MGAQIILCDGFEVVSPPEMSDLILFGSDQSSGSTCGESTVTTEEDGTVFSGDSSPGGAAEEEWPEANKPFSFYFVKRPAYDDFEIKAKINEADSEIYQYNKLRIDISNAQKTERAEISSLYAKLESLGPKSEGYKMVFEEKKKEFDALLEALRNQRCSSTDQLCFSMDELNHLIYIAHYVIEHGSIGLEEEHWVLKETDKSNEIVSNEDSLVQKEASIDRLKLMAVELNEVKKELEATTWNINRLSEKLGQIQNKMMMLDVEMAHVLELRDRSYERIKMLRIQRDKGNAAYFQSLAVMRKAKELAASGNVRDLEVFSSSEVDRFMTSWNNDKAYRDDYVKRISLSLYERELSLDGRIRDQESKAQVVQEKQALVKNKKEGMVVMHKRHREDSGSNSSQDGTVITAKQKKEVRKKVIDFNRSSDEESVVTDLEFPVYENPKKQEEEVDEETMKEMKREEQLEKAKLAMERKKKLQEKAAAKAALRAQKEAEKKLKECEKKAKKKAAANSSELDKSQEVSNELEEVRSLAVSGKEKQRSMFPKKRSFRYKHRGRGTEALPKAILNRRRAHQYWVWGVSSAALALALSLGVLLLR
ncbi:Proton pump-interactor 2 [Raphanus sativus]|uniref:Proton pump-interactor 2 isoform X2 n=1 Tax=Raphanus sativus TaxID=3726 RepID=A0A9W3BS22_RAPSA|nr:proton pump-interactor 2 isoform X2 [Raphanus sativus]KAJ4897999.1 Proton pump-interactor 2 [Raphanus sativus]